jgi:hypothetical protein
MSDHITGRLSEHERHFEFDVKRIIPYIPARNQTKYINLVKMGLKMV